MIKLLVSDVDGTLFQNGRIEATDIVALGRLQEMNIQVCLASGRMYPELQAVTKQIGVASHLISQNGSFVHVRGGELLYADSFNLDIAEALLQTSQEQAISYVVSCADNQIYIPATDTRSDLRDRMFMPVVECGDMNAVFRQGILPCKFAFFGELEALHQLRLKIDERYPAGIDSYIADKDCLDVMPSHVSKGRGLRALMDHLEIQSDEVVCVGDAFNDLSMFEQTPYSFAMQHSHLDVRKCARASTETVAAVVDWIQAQQPIL